jgi:hypothetical protein
MDAPPSYDEAIAGKTQQAGQGVKPVYTQYRSAQDSSHGTHNFGPPPPPIGGYQNASAYQEPQVKNFSNGHFRVREGREDSDLSIQSINQSINRNNHSINQSINQSIE